MRASLLKLTILTVLVLFVATTVPASDARSQTAGTFTNQAQEAAHGLHVVLSAAAKVMIDGDGMAGPFKGVSKNGTSHIILSNPADLVQPGDKIELSFSSQAKKLDIKKWWWVDAKGKKLGAEQKG